jgi:hypothetical protein
MTDAQRISLSDLLTFQELADLAGVSVPTIRFLRRANRTPPAVYYKRGVRFLRGPAEAWVAASGHKPQVTSDVSSELFILTD